MRTIELSSHPADALRIARQRRAAAGRQSRAEFADALARHELLVRRAEAARDRAREQQRWLTWLRAWTAIRKLRRLLPEPPMTGPLPTGTASSITAETLAAGVTGDQQVVGEFSRAFGDDWALLRGYCNKRGEIDHLLLGPPGLIAIESKHLNATVHCAGDSWRFEKFDRFGTLVSRGILADRGGRSPSVQLNEPADLLEQFLGGGGGAVAILRVVLFTHPSSRLGSCENPSVHVATSALSLAGQLNDMPPVLGAAQRARLEELIARDHRYHDVRRPPARQREARKDRSARSASR
jgi:Nuclease-related domain